jgi:protein-tyrosine phosphatase
MTGSPLGPEVKWIKISSSAYGGMAKDTGKSAFTNAFRVFLDEKNYPIDFHCIAGADRTGSLAFILNGLLGVEEEELWRDWEVTAFQKEKLDFGHRTRFSKLVKVFEPFPGTNINEKIVAYVKSVGFTDADIEKFRALMLEP